MRVVVGLLVLWLVLALIGALVKALFLLLVIGAVLFVATALYGSRLRGRGSGGPR